MIERYLTEQTMPYVDLNSRIVITNNGNNNYLAYHTRLSGGDVLIIVECTEKIEIPRIYVRKCQIQEEDIQQKGLETIDDRFRVSAARLERKILELVS